MSDSLLLVIDFINDIVHLDGKVAAGAEAIAKNNTIAQANKAIQWARESDHHLAFVKVGFSVDYSECPAAPSMFARAKELGSLTLGEWGTEFHQDLDFKETDKVITKHRVSAFYNTDLETVLRASNVKHLYLCGVSTNMAIFSTAREAHDRDYQVTVLSDACSAPDENMHKLCLQMLERTASVITVDELGK